VGLKGLFFVGIIATIMSTVDSYCLVGGMTISHDIYNKILGKNPSQKGLVNVSRLGVIVTCLFAVTLALIYNDSIKSIWYVVGSITFSALFFPTLAGIFIVKNSKSGAGLPSMICGSLGAVLWFVTLKLGLIPEHWKLISLIEPLYIGLLFSVVGFFMFHRERKSQA
jgi:SSS family solute:Na+ symporter